MPQTKPKSAAPINWEPIGNTVCEILTITRSYPTTLVEMAQEHSVPYECVVAAAIVHAISLEVEQQLKSPRRRSRQ